MKYYNILGHKIEEDKLKARAVKLLKEAGFVLLALLCGFAVWLLLSV